MKLVTHFDGRCTMDDQAAVTPARGGCTLCGELLGEFDLDLFGSLKIDGLDHRTVGETASLILMVTIGPLARGHALVVPKEHVHAIGDLNARAFEELRLVLRAVRDSLSVAPGRLVVFEHGEGYDDLPSGSCTTHAHLHVVPHASYPPRLPNSPAPIIPLRSIDDLRLYRGDQKAPYLLTGTYPETLWLSPVLAPQQCQALRRSFADLQGVEEFWDWELFPRVEELRDSCRYYQASGVFERIACDAARAGLDGKA